MDNYKVGDKFVNNHNGCTGVIVAIDDIGYTFEFGITDFFVEKEGNFKINRQTVNIVQLNLLIEQGVIERLVKPSVEAVSNSVIPALPNPSDFVYQLTIRTINKSGVPLYLKKIDEDNGDYGRYTYELLGQSQFGDEMEATKDPFKLLDQMFPLEDSNTVFSDNYALSVNTDGADALERLEFARKKMRRD